MEETKELQTMYKIFRCLIYLSLIVEFFEYAIDPALLDYWGGIVCDIHSRVKRWFIYMDGNLVGARLLPSCLSVSLALVPETRNIWSLMLVVKCSIRWWVDCSLPYCLYGFSVIVWI